MDLDQATHILVIYHEDTPQESLEIYLNTVKSKSSGIITAISQAELLKDELKSQYDLILSGFIPPFVNHNNKLIIAVMQLLVPDGIFKLCQPTNASMLPNIDEFVTSLLINGYIKGTDSEIVELKDEEKAVLHKQYDVDAKLYQMTYKKPSFEIGSSISLKLPAKPANVWKLDADDDDETIDPDNLLDEDDLKKPDPATLKVCGTTGLRKACKDCSCGLAEELQNEGNPQPEPIQKSSCGSCYLGDAFRCASCPYLGMPAFKPGEKIQLSANQLEADL